MPRPLERRRLGATRRPLKDHPAMKRITETFRVYEYSRVTEIDDKPSLRPMPAEYVYDTTAEEISQTRGPGIAKCGAESRRRRTG
jgi:hypothetical protein